MSINEQGAEHRLAVVGEILGQFHLKASKLPPATVANTVPSILTAHAH